MPGRRLPFVDEATERKRANSRRAYYRWRDSGKRQDYILRTRYGITRLEFDRLMSDQNGLCAICGRGPNGHGRLHVDHDHATGTVRGLLCFSCNYAVGAMQDDPAVLRQAAAYLDNAHE